MSVQSSDSALSHRRSGSTIANMALAALIACLGQRFLANFLGRLTQLANVVERPVVAGKHADRERHEWDLPQIAGLVVDHNIAVASVFVVVVQANLGVEALGQ